MKRYSIVQRHKSRGIKTWYGRIADGPLVRYVSLGVTRKADAMEWLHLKNAEKFFPEKSPDAIADKDFNAAVKTFLESVETLHGPESLTLRLYGSLMRKFVKWAEWEGVSTLRGLTKAKAQAYAATLRASTSAKTMRESVRLCRQFTKWCADTFELDGWEPFRSVALPKLERRRKPFWTLEQVNAILDAAPTPDFRLFWSLMAFAGLRQAEACGFGPESLREDGTLHVIGKGNKEAFLPVSGRLDAEIRRHGDIVSGMFNRAPYKSSGSNSALRKAVKAAGLDGDGRANNHRFRHSFASNLIRAGVNAKAVQQLMRHESIRITLDTYSHLLNEDLRAAADALS